MVLNDLQLKQLAMPIVDKLDEIIEFFKDPVNQKHFEDWCEKYGEKKEMPSTAATIESKEK